MIEVDVVVIGGGIAGASAAYELAADASVVLLEREPAFDVHATGRSAAVFRESAGRAQLRALAVASRPLVEEPPDGFADHPLLSPLGLLTPAPADRLAELENLAGGLSPGVDATLVDERELREICPVLSPKFTGGLFERSAMAVDVHGLHTGFLRGLRERGGVALRNAEVTSLEWDGHRWFVEAAGEVFLAPVVVNAAGAWCDQVAKLAGVPPLGLVARRRTVFIFPAPDGHDVRNWPMVREIDEQFYFRPEGHDMLGSPCDETPMVPMDVRHTELDVAIGIERIQEATNMTIRHVRHAWAGLRTFAPDGVPVCGFDPERPGFFWLAGQGGNGIQISWALGRLTATLVGDKAVPRDLVRAGVDPEALAPNRFRGQEETSS